MLEPVYATLFRKQFKLAQKRGLDVYKLRKVMGIIIDEKPLPPERKNHPLHGDWEGCLECHIQGDWVLIYEIDRADHSVTFLRTGSHSDLF